jgi:hypothetical protein
MDELSNDQLIAVFGKGFEDLKLQSVQQTRILQNVEKILDKRVSIEDNRYAITAEAQAKRDKRQKEPQEVTFSKSAQKSLKALDQSDKYSALLKEVKTSQKKETGSIFKFLSPILLLLGGIAGLAFGVQKIPAMKKMFENFQKGAVFTSLKNILNVFNKKNLEFKEFIRGIPFVGRLIDAYDGFSLIAQGQIEKGIKRLAFAIPGAEFIASFFGSSKQRLLGDYDAKSDKSKQFSLFGKQFSFEQVVDGIFNGITNFLNPVIDFFGKVSSLFVQLYQVATKGSNINFKDITGILDQIAVYFPVLTPVINFLSMLTEKAFKWQASKQTGETNINSVNLGDIFNSIFDKIAETINSVVSTVLDIVNAISLIFSGNKTAASKGFKILDDYAPGISNGLRFVVNTIDNLQEIDKAEGLDKLKAAFKAITSRNEYYNVSALDRKAGNDINDKDSFYQARENSILEEQRLKKEIENEKSPNKKVVLDAFEAGTAGAVVGGSVGLASSVIPGTPLFGQPLTATLLTGIVSGVITSAGSLILGWSRENLKDMYGDDKDRIERIKKLEQSQQLQQNTIKTLDTEGGKQIEIDYEKLKPVSSNSSTMEKLKASQDQNMDKADFKKMVDDILNGLNKHAILLEALLKTQAGNNTSLATIASNTLKSSNVIVNSNSNFNNFSNKAASNYEFQMEDLSKSVYA